MITYTVSLGNIGMAFTIPAIVAMTHQTAKVNIRQGDTTMEAEVPIIDLRAFAQRLVSLTDS